MVTETSLHYDAQSEKHQIYFGIHKISTAFLVLHFREQCIQFHQINTGSFHACTLYDVADTDMTSTVENLLNMISTYAKILCCNTSKPLCCSTLHKFQPFMNPLNDSHRTLKCGAHDTRGLFCLSNSRK